MRRVHAAAGAVVLRGGRRVPVPELRHVRALGQPARQAPRAPPPAGRHADADAGRGRRGIGDDDGDKDGNEGEAAAGRRGVGEAEGAHAAAAREERGAAAAVEAARSPSAR